MSSDIVVGIPFQCDISTNNLCFNNATCQVLVDTTVKSCVCSEDSLWSHDYSSFHTPNCSLPPYLYLVNFIVLSLGSTLALIRLYKALREGKPGKPRDAQRLFVLLTILYWIHALSLWLQDGLFEAGLVFVGFITITFALFTLKMNAMVLAPIYAMTGRSMRQVQTLHRVILTITVFCTIISVCLSIAYCRDENPATYNMIFVCLSFFIFGFGVLATVVNYHKFNELIAILEKMLVDRKRETRSFTFSDNNNEQEPNSVSTQMSSFRKVEDEGSEARREVMESTMRLLKRHKKIAVHVFIFTGGAPFFILSSVIIGIGSFPFLWIFVIIASQSVWPVAWKLCVLKEKCIHDHFRIPPPSPAPPITTI